MKKIKQLLVIISITLFGNFVKAQNGLENVYVEKYYVSDAADAAGSSGVLPTGSVTYRVYADMLPGYKLQAIYGVSTHSMTVQTSTTFFNNEDYGSTSPTASATNVRKNSAMLDSYFSVGAAANGKVGVLKSEDTDGSPGNNIGILQNNDATASGAINIGTTASTLAQDGMITGTVVAVTFVGINNTGNGDLGVFDGTSQVGGLFTTSNGSVAALGGFQGPTASNKVLIGQFTTDGIFQFSLNIQIGTPTGGVQKYVAANPVSGEISIYSLVFNSSDVPAAPVATSPYTYCVGATASQLSATATTGNTLKWYTVPTGGTGSTTAPTPSTTITGTITYYVVQVNSIGNESTRTPIVVNVNAPTITVNSPTICFGQTATLTATGGVSYTWSSGAIATGVNTATVNPTSTTNYTVTGTGSDGCTATATSTVTVNTAPAQPAAFTTSTTTVNTGQNGVVYTIPNDVTATSYTWTYSGSGATISGTGNSITVNFSTTASAGILSVTANNSCGTSTARTLNISINGFVPGNLAIFVALTNTTNTTGSIVELNTTSSGQTAVSTYTINGTTGANAIRFSGSATSTAYLSNSKDGSLLCFTGANTTTSGATNINTILPRAVGTLDYTYNFNLATTYTATSGNQARGASSLNNTTWFIGDQGGFYSNGTASASPSGNIRSVKAFGNTMYAFTSSATAPPVGTISAATGGTYTALPGLANGATTRQDFYMISSGSNGSIYDILYILDATSGTVGAIFKYSLVAGSWVANGSYATTFGGFGITAKTSGGGANIYVTDGTGATSANHVIKLTDVNGYNAAISITTANNVTLYTAAAGTIAKGIAFAPVATCTAPSITSITNNSSICAGTALNFSVTATGTATLSYSWTGPNGFTSSLQNPSISNATTAATGTYTVTVTNSCGSASLTTSATVNALPTVTITPNGTTTFCQNSSVTLAASSGSSYLWSTGETAQNIVVNTSGTYSVTVTNNNGCSAASSTLTVTVIPSVIPLVSIASDAGSTICNGTSVTFTATATNGGTPSYQWKLNGNDVGTNSATYTNTALANNDAVSCIITSNGACVSPTTASSNTVTITVNATVLPSVSIASNAGSTICSGTNVTFTATPTNGGTPSYQWKLNGNDVGTNSATYSNNTLVNGDLVTCLLTSNATCVSPATASSNTLTISVTTSVVTAVSIISGSGNTICSGTSVTFTATPTNGGTSPSYQWKLNGNDVGTNSITYSSNTLATNDLVTCVMTSNNSCASQSTASSNTITMTVNSTPSQPAFTTKTTFVYKGQNAVAYAVPNQLGVAYTWTYSGTGATINGTGNAVSIDYLSSSTSGTLSVTASIGSCESSPRTLAIVTNDAITIPTANFDYSFVTVGCNRVDYLDTAFTTGDPDYACGKSTANVYQLKRLFTEISHLNPLPHFLIMTGDIIMGYLTPSTPDTTALARQLTEWRAIYENHPLSSMGITLIAIPGNHETQDKAAGKHSFVAAENIFTRIMAPYIHGNNGPGVGGPDNLATDQSKLTYSFDYNGDHYLMIDTDPVGQDNKTPYHWIAGDLQAARANHARHIFAFGHKPAYSSPFTPAGGLDAASTLNQRDSLWKYFEKYNVEAMFSAHEHLWDSIHPHTGKTWQVINGDGGTRVEPVWVGPGRQYYGYTIVNMYSNRSVNVMGVGRNTTMSTTAGGLPYPINEDANPSTVRNNFNICLTTNSTTSVTACGSYIWGSVNHTSSGIYSFTTINAAGCDSVATLNLTINPLPTVTAGNVSGCTGSPIALSGSPAGGTFSVANPYSGPSTTYTYTYTDGNGCTATSAPASITVNPLPTVSFTLATNYPYSSPVTLTGSPAGGTFSGTGILGNTFTPATAGVGGPYTITYNYTDANGCSNSVSHTTSVLAAYTGPSSSASPYVLPVATGATTTAILTTPNVIGGYEMEGIPDGLGAFDNGNGTFTLLMNHEITNVGGVVRAHGSLGAFVSKWTIDKTTLSVLNGSDLMQNVHLWNPGTSTYTIYNSSNPSTLARFGRFCAADLPQVSAYYNSGTGLGTQERIYMNGEETNDESRAMAHIVTGANGGHSWELPALGKAAWENAVACPVENNKTIVGLDNDGTDGQVYMYIGTKTNTGTEIQKAGLTNGHPFGVKVTGFSVERVNSTTINNPPAAGTHFDLIDLGDVTNITGVAFNTLSNSNGITKFSRPEDGAWDPSHPDNYYFNTTDQLDQVNDGIGSQVGRTRVWKLHFTDIYNPELGGTIEAVLDGTEGLNMLDNMVIDHYGHILLQEDVGNAAHNGKVWQYTIATDALVQLAKHDPTKFGDIGVPATAPFNQDEETSGIIDMQDILGPGMFLSSDQAHYSIPGAAYEGGQLFQLFNPTTYNSSLCATASSSSVTACGSYAWNGHTYTNSGTFSYHTNNAAGCDSTVTLILTINPTVIPSVSIASDAGSTICSGTSVTFTATATNGGTPSYQWKLNGNDVGTNSATYTNTTLANNDAVSCIITSNATCASPNTASSNAVTMTVNTIPTPTILGTFTICSGSSTTLDAGAGYVSYLWSNGETTQTITVTTVNTYSVMVSNGNCSGSSASVTTSVISAPSQPSSFTASSANVNKGQTGVLYTVPNDANATSYNWAYSGNGATINGTGNSVNIDFSLSATTGVLSVTATNSCGTSTALTMTVTINSTDFTSGNIVVLQTTGSVSKASSSITLKEFTTSGTPGVTVILPSTGTTPIKTAGVYGGSEGFLTTSADSKLLAVGGYGTTSTFADITATSASAVPRVVGKVTPSGAYTQMASSSTFFSLNDIRGAVSDGLNFWASGASAANVDGIDYFGPGTQVGLGTSATPPKAYGLRIFNGQLYYSTQKAGPTNSLTQLGIFSLGNGLPVSGSVTITQVINTGSLIPEDFSFNPATNICYVAINLNATGGGIQKWTKTGSVWSLAYTLGTGASNIGAYGLLVDYSGANPVIYATTFESTGNRIIKITDTGAGSTATNLVTATTGVFYKGIAFAPVDTGTPTVNLSVSTNTASEAAATTVTVTATSSSTVAGDQTVSLNVTGNGITTGDYTLSNTTITIPSGTFSGSVIFTIVDDVDSEGSETAVLSISNPSSGILLGSSITQNITIADNDNFPPVIYMNTATTSNYLDGGVSSPPASPYGLSGVVNDVTDPAKNFGLDFTIFDTETPVASLTVTATSNNQTVVPDANITVTASGTNRNVKINPTGIGYANITITVSDGINNTSYVIAFAASDDQPEITPANTFWHTGMSDGSDGIALDNDYYVSGDDELDVLNVYSRSASGLPLVSYNYSSYLNLPNPSQPEVDVEAGTRSTSIANRMYFTGSMSNGKLPYDNKPNRDRLFATTVTGTGAATSFTPEGYVNIRTALLAWGDANGYSFTASAAQGVNSKALAGFSLEGMTFGPDGTTLYLGLRAPLVPTTLRHKAVIAPLLNFEAWFNNGSPSGAPTFGSPIELDLDYRGIRDIVRLSNGTYIIIAGSPVDDGGVNNIYKWTGNAADAPIAITNSAGYLLNMEGVMQVNNPGNGQLSLSELQIISDGGSQILYQDSFEAKDFGDLKLRKFRSDVITGLDLDLCSGFTVAATASGSTTLCPGNTVLLTASAGSGYTYLWSTGASTQSITSSSSTATYTVTVTNSSACSATATITVTVNPLPTVGSTASPSSTVCAGGSVTLSGTGAATYNWSGGISNASAFTPTVSGTYTVTGTDANGCVNTSTAIISLTQPNVAPVSLNTSANVVCLSSNSVTLTQTGGTLGTGAVWKWYKTSILPANLIGTSTAADAMLVITPTVTASYLLRAEGATSPCNANTAATGSVTVTVTTAAPARPTLVTGPQNLCPFAGTGTATYTATAVSGYTSYKWTLLPGMTATGSNVLSVSANGVTVITSNNMLSVTVNQANFINGVINVVASNACGDSPSQQSLSLTILPATPGTITGPASVCVNVPTNVVYSVPSIASAYGVALPYNWSVPLGMNIISGNGTSAITVAITPNSPIAGNVTVFTQNPCGLSATAGSKTVNSTAGTLGAISGNDNICANIASATPVTYSVAPLATANSYIWTVPAGASIVGSNGNTSVSVMFTNAFAAKAQISVYATNGCKNTATVYMWVYKTPNTPVSISVIGSPCDASMQFTTAAINGATSYKWTVPVGYCITGAAGCTSFTSVTPTITVTKTGAVSGNVTVAAVNACGASAARTLPVSCASPIFAQGDSKDKIIITNIYPNPTTGEFTIDLSSEMDRELILEVYDVLGNRVNNQQFTVISGTSSIKSTIEGFNSGLYFVRVLDKDNNLVYSNTLMKH